MSDDEATHLLVRQLEGSDWYAYSEEEFADILADAYVDLREIVGDEDAAECVDIVYRHLTDDFHSHTTDE